MKKTKKSGKRAKVSGRIQKKASGKRHKLGFFRAMGESLLNVDAKFFIIMLIDALFIAKVYLLFTIWNFVINDKANALQIFHTMMKQSSGFALTVVEKTNLNNFLYFTIVMTVLMIAFIAFLWTLVRNISWNIILKKPLFEDEAIKTLTFAMTWFFMWAIVYALLTIYVKQFNYLLYAVLVLLLTLDLIYFTVISDIIYNKNKKQGLRDMFVNTFKIGFKKLPDLAAPYIFVAAGLVAFLLMVFQLPFGLEKFDLFVLLLALVAFTAWVRYYFWHVFHIRGV